MLASYLSVLRRRLLPMSALTALFALTAILYVSSRPEVYRSGAVVDVRSSGVADALLGQQQGYEEPERKVATEVEVVESQPVAERATSLLRAAGFVDSAEELAERVDTAPRGAANAIEISGRYDSPEQARTLTEAFVVAYQQHRNEQQRTELRRLEADLRDKLAAAERRLSELSRQGVLSGDQRRERDAASAQIKRLDDLLTSTQLRLAVSAEGPHVLSPPSIPERPEGAGPLLLTLGGVLASLLLAVAAVFAWELLRNPVRTRREAETVAGMLTLAELRGGSGRAGQHLSRPEGSGAELTGGLGLRLALQGLLAGALPRRVLVAGLPGDAFEAVQVALALGESSTGSGRRVLLVTDAVPSSSRTVGAESDNGAEDAHLSVGGHVVWALGDAGLWVVPATRGAGSNPGVLDDVDPTRVLEEMHRLFDAVVVVVARSASDGVEPAAVAHLAQAVVVVCVLGETPGKELKRLATELRAASLAAPGLAVVSSPVRGWRAVDSTTEARGGTATSATRMHQPEAPVRGATPRHAIRE